MPDLNLLLNAQKIKPEEPSAKKKFSRGIRPDHIARGEFLQTSEDTALSKLNTNERTDSETDNKLETKWQQTDSKPSTQLATEVATSSPIVVVSSNSTNTTNTETQNPDAPCFVIPIELTGKVSRKQLLEFVNSGIISEYDLQLSLDAFAYDLKNKLISVKHASNPVALLIGAIKNNGSYNSAKYIEVLKTELKPFIQEQREVSEIKQEQKSSKDWEEFLKFKLELPEDYKKLEAKAAQIGFTGDILQEFTFLEFKKVILKINDEEFANPLRPPLVLNP
jgi:hypothetical protein